jgi:hypothetical protein
VTSDSPFDRYLEGDTPLSRAYQDNATELPPMHIDSAILAAARARTAANDLPSPWWTFKGVRSLSPFGGGWTVPATVASFVVVASLAMVVGPESEVRDEALQETTADRPLLQSLDDDIEPVARVLAPKADASRNAAAEAPGKPSLAKAKEGARLDSAAPSTVQASSMPALEEQAAEAKTAPSLSDRKAESSSSSLILSDAPNATMEAPLAPASPLPSDAERVKKSRQVVEAMQQAESRRQRFTERRQRIRREREILGESLQKPAERATQQKSSSDPAGAALGSEKQAPASIVSGAATAAEKDSDEQSGAVLRAPAQKRAVQLDVSARLAQIRELIKTGQLELARTSLRSLLNEAPDLEVPDDIRSALASQ